MLKRIFISLFIISLSITSSFGFETKTLNNGQTVVVQQVKNNPIVIIDTWVKTGSINENDKNTGVSHFLEHLLFKGSKNYSTGEFDRILESKGGVVNAATSKDFTHFYIQLPAKYFDTALKLHSDMLLNPVIPDEELEKERKVVIEEISKDLNNPQRKVYENFVDMLYASHPYKRQVIGTKEVISEISRKEIFDYYNKYYIPQNMITIVIGDVEPKEVFEKVSQTFNTPKRHISYFDNIKEELLTAPVSKTEFLPVNSGYLIIGYRSSDITSKDTYALDVLSAILGEGRSSVFYKNIKENSQLAFSIESSNVTYKEDGMFMIEASFAPENLEKLKTIIFSEIDNVINNGVSESQIALAKSLIETETKYSRETISSIASQIGYTTVLANTTEYYDNYLKNINAVTKKDIQCVAKKYLTKNRSITSVVMPEDFKNSEIAKLENSTVNYKAEFVKESGGTEKYLLSNNATLLISPNTFNDIIAISIYAKGGSFLEKIPTTSNLMAATILSGTNKYSKTDLAKIMEENGIKILPQASQDAFIINIMTTKPHLKKTFEILNEVVNNATFSQEEIDKAKLNKYNIIKQSEDIPQSKALEAFREMIYGNSEYSIANKRFTEYYPKVRQKDILEYYNNIFAAQNLIIAVNGNVGKSEIVEPLSEMFKQNGKIFVYPENKIPSIKKPKSSIKTMKDLGTAWIFTGWQTCGVLNKKDYAALTVIDSLLGSGMSSRLFVNLREKEGLAYQVGASYSPKLLKGAFIMYIGTNPNSLEKSKNLMFKEISKLKTEFVGEEELQEAKDKIIGRYILSMETNLDKASQITWFEASSRGFDFGKEFEDLIYSVTPEDIKIVANKYFNDNNILSIIKEGK